MPFCPACPVEPYDLKIQKQAQKERNKTATNQMISQM